VQKNLRFLDVKPSDTCSNHRPPLQATSAYDNQKYVDVKEHAILTILAGFQVWSKATKTYELMTTLLPFLVLWEHSVPKRYQVIVSKFYTVTMFVIFTTHVSCLHVYSCWQCLAIPTFISVSINDWSQNWEITTNSESALFSMFLFYIQHLSSFKVLHQNVPIWQVSWYWSLSHIKKFPEAVKFVYLLVVNLIYTLKTAFYNKQSYG